MIVGEKELEDYICEHQEEFIEALKSIYGKDEDIKLLGRQVKIGESNIADLIYYYEKETEFETDSKPIIINEKWFIIVELKYRELVPKDLTQISRYMSALREKLVQDYSDEYETFVEGLFVSFGQDTSMQEITINFDFNDLHFLNIEENISFKPEHYIHKPEYIEKLKLDERIEKLDWS